MRTKTSNIVDSLCSTKKETISEAPPEYLARSAPSYSA